MKILFEIIYLELKFYSLWYENWWFASWKEDSFVKQNVSKFFKNLRRNLMKKKMNVIKCMIIIQIDFA